MVTKTQQEEKRCVELEKRLQHAEKQAAYYQKLAEQAGIMRLRETEELSKLLAEHKLVQEELQQHREHLEELVEKRTAKLIKAMEEARGLNEQLQQEIVERQHVEGQIRISLQEKEVLLKEIHHRVKNNLQVISSLLNLQAQLLQDDQAQIIFQESRQRITLMALIHEKLYRSEDLANIDFKEYVTALIHDLSRSYYSSSQTVQWRIDVTDVHFGIDTAIPCGLIVNELISNALKYAFPEGTGSIRVHLSQIPDGRYELIVNDDGIGLPEEFSMEHLNSLGLQLVQGLATEQLNGEFELNSRQGAGTTWRIVFP